MLNIPKITKAYIAGETDLPASKSISHRYLVIRALSGSGFLINNLSDSNDTLLLQNALNGNTDLVDFEDAATPMRFYLAYAAAKNLKVTITGNERLRKRPVAPLVDALGQLGCRIEYLENQGYLPLRILEGADLSKSKVIVEGNLSSQFVSALLLIAPYFREGLVIEQSGKVISVPYINLTVDAMQKSGAQVVIGDNIFKVEKGGYTNLQEVDIEADWSAATFLYTWMVARPGQLTLHNLFLDSMQGDAITAGVFDFFGIRTIQNSGVKGGITISSGDAKTGVFEHDFTDTPDMFPALVATCAYLRINARLKGVKNLALKESNRILAMKDNLLQAGTEMEIISDDELVMTYNEREEKAFYFKSYGDHRIAMACSIFAFRNDITIDDGTVVKKSFPAYWEIFRAMGFPG